MSLSLHQGMINVDMYNTLKGTRLFHYCFQCSLYFQFACFLFFFGGYIIGDNISEALSGNANVWSANQVLH